MARLRDCGSAVAALTLTMAIGASAFAADLGGGPPRRYADPAPGYQPLAIEQWTGFYFGGTLGYATGGTEVRGGSGSFDLDANGGVGTLFTGYNWQVGRTVLGVEADIGTGYLDDRIGSGIGEVSSELNALGSFRARAGFLVTPAFLVYGTAGLAIADYDFKANGNSTSETLLGYQVGVGTELMLAPRWTLRMEYLYTDLGDEKINHSGLSNTYDPDFHTLRAGFAFKF